MLNRMIILKEGWKGIELIKDLVIRVKLDYLVVSPEAVEKWV
jgi:hypothetical protein